MALMDDWQKEEILKKMVPNLPRCFRDSYNIEVKDGKIVLSSKRKKKNTNFSRFDLMDFEE